MAKNFEQTKAWALEIDHKIELIAVAYTAENGATATFAVLVLIAKILLVIAQSNAKD